MRSPLRRLPSLALSLLVVSALFAPIASAKAPTVTTGAIDPTSTQTATLFGTVNPNGIATAYQFEWRETAFEGEWTSFYDPHLPMWWGEGSAGSGTSDVPVSQKIPTLMWEPLKPDTVYHYRLVAQNGKNEYSFGKAKTFKLGKPTLLSSHGEGYVGEGNAGFANLYASVNPYGVATTYQFEWGPTTSYGNKVPASPKSLGSGDEAILASEKLSSLEPYTYYHFRVVLTNKFGTTTSADQTFYVGEEE